jgi:hypothetical protein
MKPRERTQSPPRRTNPIWGTARAEQSHFGKCRTRPARQESDHRIRANEPILQTRNRANEANFLLIDCAPNEAIFSISPWQ